MANLFTNPVSLMSAMLAPSMRSLFKDNSKIIKGMVSQDIYEQFTDIEASMPKSVDAEGLREILKLKNYDSMDTEVIVQSYSAAYNPSTEKVAYDSAREAFYRLFMNSVRGDSLNLFESIKNSRLAFPEYGFIQSEHTRTVKFTDIKITDADSILGKSIKSSFDLVNELSLGGKGYLQDQLICVTAPPGCFTGDTQVVVNQTELVTMEELYRRGTRDIEVFTVDDSLSQSVTTSKYCNLSGYTDTLVEVQLDRGKPFRCTPDHKFITLNKGWVSAKDLTRGTKLASRDKLVNLPASPIHVGDLNYFIVTSVDEVKLNEPVAVYDLIEAGDYHNYAISVQSN